MPERPLLERGPTPDLAVFMDKGRMQVELALAEVLPGPEEPPANLHEAMRHSVFAGGKRLRPLLVIAGGQACGSGPDAVMPAACAVELLHTYSLIHDDLPSFDDEELRRGKLTCHMLYGDAVAILAGDALQALAFEHLAQAAADATRPDRWLAAIATIGAAVGSRGMCGGQTMDIEAAGGTLELAQLRTLHAAKTGALLTASVTAGGILAGAGEAALAALRVYGDAMGLAFQIVDDLLDIEGDVAELGKRPGGDADRGQPTFPALIGIDAARAEAARLRDEAVAALQPLGVQAGPLRELAGYIVDRSR